MNKEELKNEICEIIYHRTICIMQNNQSIDLFKYIYDAIVDYLKAYEGRCILNASDKKEVAGKILIKLFCSNFKF